MKAIGVILKKELKKYFTDYRMVIGMILPGLLIFVLYMFMGEFLTTGFHTDFDSFNVYIENEPQELSGILNELDFEINLNEDRLSKNEIINKIEDKQLDLYIIYPKDFYQNITNSKETIPNVEIYYNSSSESSNMIYNIYLNSLISFETNLTNLFDINSGQNKYDLASEADFTVMMFSMMLPFILMTVLFSVAMSICAESIAGEKERGTIATLLVTPVKRGYIAIGKTAALGITTLFSALFTFGGIIASFPNLIGGNLSLDYYNVGTILMLLLVLAVTVLFFTICLTIISTIAKTTKEASSYSVPLMIVVILVGVTSFMGTSLDSTLLYLIPIYNSILGLTSVFSMELSIINCLVFVVSNLIYIGLGIFILTRMFRSEKIMFNR